MKISLAIGGNCNLDFMVPSLKANLKILGYNVEIIKIDYNNWIAAALNSDIKADFWLIWHSSFAATLGGIERPQTDIINIQNACNVIISKGSKVFFIMPEALDDENDPFSFFIEWRKDIVDLLEKNLPTKVVKINIEYIQRTLGDANWYSPKYWLMTKSPCHPNALTQIGKECSQIISQAIRPKIKAIISDLDDTLWGGIIGDDGLIGIRLDPYGEGRAFLELQRFLKDLILKGIPLSVVSKNELTIAETPFLKHNDMILKREDVIYFEASWEPKSIAIKKIVNQLNLGMDSVCFLDDNPFEREQVQKELPDLYIPQLPEDPEERVSFLISTGLFIYPVVLSEDRQRVQNYVIEAKRHEILSNAPDITSYLQSLDLTLTAHPITEENIERVVSLIQKTNQFNLSNRRLHAQDVISLSETSGSYTYCFSLKDKFGDYGIISVLIAIKDDKGFFIDTWVLSCRVFGRQVEDAILEHLSKKINYSFLSSKYMKSDKNKLVYDFLIKKGFSSSDEITFTTLQIAPSINFVTIKE
ncbi:HAD-IIIC family phosphatase [Leptospira alstonii]|uniref:HAD-IIIC family phosphatase n=1 Tax=Leptospira alstonii TaxID=28452 RepID=UPI00138F281D|nr:HAD-IIIC family phosphatase [Leptospira alstonii]